MKDTKKIIPKEKCEIIRREIESIVKEMESQENQLAS